MKSNKKNKRKPGETIFDRILEDNLKNGKNKSKKETLSFCKCTDLEGNVLEEDDVLFGNEENLPENQTVELVDEEMHRYYNTFSSDVEYIFDKKGDNNFPVGLDTPDGKMYYKFSSYTGECLPYLAGSVEEYAIGLKGATGVGKTTYFLQTTTPEFFDMISDGTNVCISNNMPKKVKKYARYAEEAENLKKGILPEPSKRGEELPPYVFLATRGQHRKLIKIQDIDGQACVENPSWSQKKYAYDMIFFMIGADELIAETKEEKSAQYKKVLEELKPRLEILTDQPDKEVMIILTKADLLDQTDPYLKGLFENTVKVDERGKIKQVKHRRGFDVSAFERRSRAIKKYFKETHCSFFNNLVEMVPESRLTFCMIASVGEVCDHTYEKYSPFCVDEPLTYVLYKNHLYPAMRQKEEKEEKSNKNGKSESVWDKICRFMGLDDIDEWDEDEFDEEDFEDEFDEDDDSDTFDDDRDEAFDEKKNEKKKRKYKACR